MLHCEDEQNAFLVSGSLRCGLQSNREALVFTEEPVLVVKDEELQLSAKGLLAAGH